MSIYFYTMQLCTCLQAFSWEDAMLELLCCFQLNLAKFETIDWLLNT